jgi:hypothetical protein
MRSRHDSLGLLRLPPLMSAPPATHGILALLYLPLFAYSLCIT